MSRFLLFFLVATVASASLHAALAFRLRARGFRYATHVAVGGALLVPLARLSRLPDLPDGFGLVEAVATLELVMVLLVVPLLVVLDLLVDRVAPRAAPAPVPERRVALQKLSLGVASAAGVVPPLWGIRARHALDVVELPVRLAKLPRVLDGFTVVQVSDVHVGEFLDDRDLDRIFERVRGIRADLVVMTGDLVHDRPRHVPLAAAWLARLAAHARHGAIAIPGNHEHYVGRDVVLSAVARTGVRVLVNEHTVVAPAEGGGFVVGGVEDAFHGSDPVRAFSGSAPDRARVLLAHQPQIVRLAGAAQVDLQLSGHTHGGQVRPFGPLAVGVLYPWVSGRYQVGATTLYVNRGLGTSGPPSRVAVPPEVTKVVLVSG